MEKLKRGRPRKIKEEPQEQAEVSDASTKYSTEHIPSTTDDGKVKQLQFKYDNIDKIWEQQNARYEKIKGELALKRLMNTVFGDKYTNDQRLELLKDLQTKLNNN
jgi:hypothetical protein